jgi:histone H3/H4
VPFQHIAKMLSAAGVEKTCGLGRIHHSLLMHALPAYLTYLVKRTVYYAAHSRRRNITASDVLQAIAQPGHIEQVSKRDIALPQYLPLFVQQPFSRKHHFQKLLNCQAPKGGSGGAGGAYRHAVQSGGRAQGRGKKRKMDMSTRDEDRVVSPKTWNRMHATGAGNPSNAVKMVVDSVHSPYDRSVLRRLLLPSSAPEPEHAQRRPLPWLDWTDYDPSNAIFDVLAQVHK